MADFTVQFQCNYSSTSGSGDKRMIAPETLSFSQSAIGRHDGLQSIGTSWEAINTGDIAQEGQLYLRNTDATNFITYGSTANGELRLSAGRFAWVEITTGVTLNAKADTAAVNIERILFEK